MLILFLSIIKFILILIPVLLSVAFITLFERKLLSLIGLRLGPNKVSLVGFLQPLGDALKLSNKQTNNLTNFSGFFYYYSSFFMFFSSILLWASCFVNPPIVPFKFSILLFFLVLSFNSFNSILSGWSTFSKYSLIGTIRTVAQLVSYESVLYLCVFSIIFIYLSFSYMGFLFLPSSFSFFFLLPFFFIWIPSFLAELNRTPYDFSEGESELVSGFNTEFGSSSFTMIFLAEYSNIIFFSFLTSFLFFFGLIYFFFPLVFFFVIWIRSVLPRFRFDKLMMLAWKFFIPFLTLLFSCLCQGFN